MKDAIDAKADGQLLLGRLQVNVGSAALESLVDHLLGRPVALGGSDAGDAGRVFIAPPALADELHGDAAFFFLAAAAEADAEILLQQILNVPGGQHAELGRHLLVAQIHISQSRRSVKNQQQQKRNPVPGQEPDYDQADKPGSEKHCAPLRDGQIQIRGILLDPTAGRHPAQIGSRERQQLETVEVKPITARKRRIVTDRSRQART